MNDTPKTGLPAGLDRQLQQIIALEDLEAQRAHLKRLCEAGSGVDLLDCAAALLFLLQSPASLPDKAGDALQPQRTQPLRQQPIPQHLKMVRYRLDVGRQHQITVEELKKMLVEESGVDKNNITHVDIQDFHTLIELPDEMPPDIFQHLKTVEINHQKLGIRRVKNRRAKKHGKPRYGRNRQPIARQQPEAAGFPGKN
ncbi:DbpA RNA binding domain-containing protein [Methylomicrobium agile]|nr:DbpA RNA binding domain-containing protein [Methylomicrobium agile]